MIVYPDDVARRFGEIVDAAWVALLFLPLGFWLRRGRVSAAAIIISLAALAILPAAGLMGRTTALEWVGAMMGVGMGMGARKVLRAVDRRSPGD